MKSTLSNVGPIAFFGLVATLVVSMVGGSVFMAGFGIWNTFQRDDLAACVVEHKESTAGGSSNEYRVYTDHCGVLKVDDSVFAGRWDSADAYHELTVGETYDMHVQGGRYPFFSMFPNVLTATPTP